MREVLIGCLLATSVAMAGGDPGKVRKLPCDGVTTTVAEGVKVQCGPCVKGEVVCPQPCKECPDCVCNPAPATVLPPLSKVEYVHVREEPKPFWFVPLSAMYLEDPGVGAGIGYQWKNRVTLSGQALYRWSDDGVFQCPDTRSGRCKRTIPGPQVPCDRERLGGIVTVTIPLGR